MAMTNLNSNSMGRTIDLVVVDDLIHQIAEEDGQATLIAYPKTERAISDYEKYTADNINAYVSNAAEWLISSGLTEQTSVNDAPAVIGLLGPSNFAYIITMFALSRLGYTVLLLSSRLPVHAYDLLLEETRCETVVRSADLDSVVDRIRQKRHLKLLSITSIDGFTMNHSREHNRFRDRRKALSNQNAAFIMHSSGSTGPPKCIYLTHAACLYNFSMGYPSECFLTLPLYHMHGHACLYRAMYHRKTCFIYNASLPLTGMNLVAAVEAVHPELLLTVPYGLKLLSESQSGVDALRNCEKVSYAGSACPDELGDRLFAHGVNLVSTYGLYLYDFLPLWASYTDRSRTEAGAILQSNRREDHEPWNYLRIIPSVKPFAWMKAVGHGIFELVLLDGLTSKIASNSDDPPKSFYTKDLFVEHHDIKGSWKHVGRLDDRVTLVNGEKVLPLPIEGRVRQDHRLREAIVFGIGKAMPGLLAFRNDESQHLSDGDFVDAIWAAVEDANGRAESFAQIGREMIVPLPFNRDYPQTDKGTFIRARVYQDFTREISAVYDGVSGSSKGTLRFGLEDMKRWLLRIVSERLDIHLRDTAEHFFAAGVNSLQAARILNIIRSELYLNGKSLSTNVVYDTQNVEQLALYLYNIQTGVATDHRPDKQVSDMADMIDIYSKFDKHVSQGPSPEGTTVLLTGSTGFLGSYILAQLLRTRSVARIYCPVRAPSRKGARDRLLTSLSGHRFLDIQQHDLGRIHAIPNASVADFVPSLLEKETNHAHLTHIIHCAWPVNFNLPLRTFEDQFSSLQNLLQLSLQARTPNPTHFLFCSSISAASSAPSPVPEAPLTSFTHPAATGYGRSKFVAEKIIQNAVQSAGAKASILRIGQIAGDTLHGFWNDSEAIPLMIRSALATGALPALNERCAWLPVDTVARSVLELAGIDDAKPPHNKIEPHPPLLPAPEPHTYNILNPHTFTWTDDFLPAVRASSSLGFETLAPKAWLRRLRASEQDPEKNPSIKLLEFWEKKIEDTEGAGAAPTFDTTRARGNSPTLRDDAPDIIAGGYVAMFVKAWMEKWTRQASSTTT